MTGTSHDSSGTRVKKKGDIMTGNLVIDKTTPILELSTDGNGDAKIIFDEGGTDVFSLFFHGSGAGDDNKLHIRRELATADNKVTFTAGGKVGIGNESPGKDLDVTGDIRASVSVITDTITENTAAAGVTIDGVLLKDGNITASGSSPQVSAVGTTSSTHIAFVANNGESGANYRGVLLKYNSVGANGELMTHNGTSWYGVATLGLGTTPDFTLTGNLVMSSGKTVDGVDVSAIPSTYLPLSGGTLTGDTIISKSTPILQLTDTDSGNITLQLKVFDSGIDNDVDIDILTSQATDNAYLRFFRNTNTSGSRKLLLCKGDGTADVSISMDLSNGNISSIGNIYVNTISESVASSGVTIDSVLCKDGQITTGTTGTSYFKSTSDINLDVVSGAAIFGGDGTGQHIAIDNNEIQSKLNGTTASGLNIQLEGGDIYFGGSVRHKALGLSTAVTKAFLDDGGVFTDYTTAANNGTANDVQLLPAAPAVDDAFYVGRDLLVGKLTFNIGTAGVGTWTIVWEYYNGSAWTALSGVTDNTSGFTVSGSNTVTYTVPTDCVRTTINSSKYYWIRARVSAFTSITTQPLGTQITVDDYYFDNRMVDFFAAAPMTLYLPAPSGSNSGTRYTIKKTTSTAGNITIDSLGTANIDGVATYTLTNQYDAVTLQCTSVEWYIISKYP